MKEKDTDDVDDSSSSSSSNSEEDDESALDRKALSSSSSPLLLSSVLEEGSQERGRQAVKIFSNACRSSDAADSSKDNEITYDVSSSAV
ncbi:hypothetical protein PHYBOEH_009853 [Phytophthora boehmeriae]|uniref:Uncharacterized protein n=1 Tax=Phytophthora boehmeriae TaxID=109152 RepID=A0A8T1VRP9_9STRA|nr:hypothetical protein PHYBOEH_009853 [Phytophthora boehmeriae]